MHSIGASDLEEKPPGDRNVSAKGMIMADLLREMEAIMAGDSSQFDEFEVAIERVTGSIILPVFRF